jgi:4-hydroxyphenylacetate 3-monooxygenase
MLQGIEAGGEYYGKYWIPNRQYIYSSQVITQDLYPRMINMLPSSYKDWSNPVIEPLIRKTQRSPSLDPEERVKFLKAAWDAIGSEFGSRHTQYEMFYAGAQFVTAGHSYRTFGWKGADEMVQKLLASVSLEQPMAAVRH